MESQYKPHQKEAILDFCVTHLLSSAEEKLDHDSTFQTIILELNIDMKHQRQVKLCRCQVRQ
jgi:hypothetical protein